jgi:hypothetical protein
MHPEYVKRVIARHQLLIISLHSNTEPAPDPEIDAGTWLDHESDTVGEQRAPEDVDVSRPAGVQSGSESRSGEQPYRELACCDLARCRVGQT